MGIATQRAEAKKNVTINKQVKCHTSHLVSIESKNSRLVKSKTAKLKNDILDI